jgi:peptide-methionine (S)-S-oxide reductase
MAAQPKYAILAVVVLVVAGLAVMIWAGNQQPTTTAMDKHEIDKEPVLATGGSESNEEAADAAATNEKEYGMQKATFAAGCFWGVEETFRTTKGVTNTSVGYTGGHTEDPTYRQVCNGNTGHAEAVRVEFDPAVVTYDQLLDVFWKLHDPTQVNRQGPDVGSQYRSAVFYHSPEQKLAAERSKQKLEESGEYSRPVATEIVEAGPYYLAEDYHQQYLKKRGLGASCHN